MPETTHAFPIVELPVTVTSGDSTAKDRRYCRHTERFSQLYKSKLPDRLLRELGGAFSMRTGFSKANIRAADRAIMALCAFLSKRPNPPKSLLDLTMADIHEHLVYLKCEYPPALSTNGKMENPWYFSQYRPLKATLIDFLPTGIWPHVDRPRYSPQEGHSPYAMKQILNACKKEIDRIRAKKDAWTSAVSRGCPKDLEWLDSWTAGSRSKLTEEQIDILIECERDPNRPTYNELAKRFGVSGTAVGSQAKLIRQGIRPKGLRDPKSVDLTLDDIIATIDKYIPDWPVVGSLADPNFGRKQHRVYESARGVLKGVYQRREEAEERAAEINGVVVSGMSKTSSGDLMNPAEQFLKRASGSGDKRGHLSAKIKDLVPNGAVQLAQQYFVTSYDWGVIYLYWCCLTGWNQETIMSVTAFQLKQMAAGINEMSPLSDDHVTIKGHGALKRKDAESRPLIMGEKVRAQRDGKAELFTHVSDKGRSWRGRAPVDLAHEFRGR